MLARKISRAKWSRKDYLAEHEIRADAITRCLRTTDDTLSWWRCSSEHKDVAEVALAVAVCPEVTKFEKIDVVVVPDGELKDAGLSQEPSEGKTAVKDLRLRHVDVVHLDLDRLGKIAGILAPRIRDQTSVFMFTRKDLITLVRNAIKQKRLVAGDLSEELRAELDKTGGSQG